MTFELTFEVAFDVDPGDMPGSADWTDLSDRLRDTASVTLEWAPGSSATVRLDNQDRALDPTNTSATHNLVPMRHARLTATVGGTDYPLFRGYVETWVPAWPQYNESIVDIVLRDGGMWFARFDTDLDLVGQRSGARIGAILDAAGWPASLRDLDTGVVWVDGYTQNSANLLQALEDSADAEDGELFFSAGGEVVFRSRHARFDTASQLTVGTDSSATYTADAVVPQYDMTLLVNRSRVELDDGEVFEASNPASMTAYGPADLSVRDLPVPEHEARGLGQWIVWRFAEPSLRLDGVRLDGNEPGLLAVLLGLERGELATFEHSPPGGGSVSYTGHVGRIHHLISVNRWVSTLRLDPYFGEAPWFTWDVAALGWDLGAKWAP